MTSPYASKDLFFEKALKSLPTALLEAMIAADLTNPGVLRLYPRYSSAELELLPEVVHVDLEDLAQSCTVSLSITQRMLHIGAAEAAKSTSSCHELDVVVSGVSSSSVSASVSLPVSLADCHPTSNATDLKGTPKKLAEVDEGPADDHTASCAPDLSGIAASTDSLATPVQKSADFPIKMGRFPRISQKSRISEKVRESPPASGLARLDGGVAIKPVRGSGSQNLRAETLSNGSLEDSSATRSKDEEEPRVKQVETKTQEVMAKNYARDASTKPPPHMRAWKTGTTKATTETSATPNTETTVKKLPRDARVDFPRTAKVQKVQADPLEHRSQQPSDFLILYHSLVRDGVLPQGFGEAFSGLQQAANLAADRQDITASRVSNLQSSGWIQARSKQAAQLTKLEKTASDQFLLAADKAPRRFRAKFQQGLYQGPNARKEAEESERTKWIELLGAMLSNTPTPMGALFAAQPSNLQLLGAGRRAATLRSRVRAVKRFLDWFAVSHAKGYPTELQDYTGYLQARQSEPCTLGALKGAHKALVFMEEVAGVTAQARFTTGSLYQVIQKELLANSIPGRPTKQAPKMFMSMLAALEELTVNNKALPYYRVYAWWILLQSWGTMRFSDHRGLKPTDVQVTGNSMSAKLTRSKTTGDDKDVAFRMVHISSCCFLVFPSWLSTGWSLLKSLADFPRDFLLPAPASNCNKYFAKS